MNILRYALVIVLFVILIFFGIGLFVPNISYMNDVYINKSVPETFEVFGDSSKLHRWVPNFKKIQLIQGRLNQIGSRYTMTVHEDGEDFELTETIVDVQENVLYAMILENDLLTTEVQVTFGEENGQTHLEAYSVVRGKGMFMRSALALMKSGLKEKGQIGYENFKKVVEDDDPD